MKITRQNIDNTTIDEMVKDFMMIKKTEGLSDRTLDSYRYAITYFLQTMNLSSDDKVGVITRGLFLQFVDTMQKKNLSKGATNHFITSMRVFLYWLMSEHYIEEFKIKLVKGQEPKIKLYTEDELSRLMNKPKKNCSFSEYRQWVVIAFILSTGARASTVISVRVEDIDFSGSFVTYTHLKNKKSVNIPIPIALTKILKDYIRMWGITDYLFPTEKNGQMSYYGLASNFNRYCKKRGVESTGLHTLRHTFCSALVKKNVSPFVIQKIMTHSSIAVTEKYVHLFGSDLQSVTEVAPINMFVSDKKIKKRVSG